MKLGMILDAPFPDDARVANECDELIKSGHEIFLFCLSYKKKFQKIEDNIAFKNKLQNAYMLT